MRTSFHHQPEAQHLILQLSTSWQADYPIFRGEANTHGRVASTFSAANDPNRTQRALKSRSAAVSWRIDGSLRVSRGPLNEWCRTCANLVRTADINVRSLPMARWIQLPLSL
jgi:hypothetical protein